MVSGIANCLQRSSFVVVTVLRKHQARPAVKRMPNPSRNTKDNKPLTLNVVPVLQPPLPGEVYTEFLKVSRPSLVYLPPTEGIRTVRSLIDEGIGTVPLNAGLFPPPVTPHVLQTSMHLQYPLQSCGTIAISSYSYSGYPHSGYHSQDTYLPKSPSCSVPYWEGVLWKTSQQPVESIEFHWCHLAQSRLWTSIPTRHLPTSSLISDWLSYRNGEATKYQGKLVWPLLIGEWHERIDRRLDNSDGDRDWFRLDHPDSFDTKTSPAVPQLGSLERETANGEQSDFIQCKNDLNRYGKEGAIGGHSFTIDPLLLSSEDPGVIDLAEDVNWDSTHPTREQPLLEEQDDGLGLDSKHISMVKKIVQAMGDEELVESLIQRGITFSTAKDSQKTRIVASHLSGDSNQFTNETTGDKVKTIKEDITDIVELPSGLGSTASVYDLVEAVLRSPSNKTCRIKPMLERAIEQGMSSEIMIGVAEHPFSASGAFQALAFGFETKGSLEDALSGTEMMGEELEPCDKETSEYKEFMERAVWMLGGNMPSIAYAIYFYTKVSNSYKD
ncbi:hypothetical protein K474DRAFT_1671419 [Panus rudis PR-1116 ss-1]|nr:hypothetical protein K474DRAFT_1676199 [Panus rudis PR-1116 ss-1]KAI0082335.1 hypothetical protein K474DRAFT_1671419 [Panus rudis PR-1116 ss-1]